VLFHGRLPGSEFLRRLPRFDLLIACSRFESFGLAALEAVAAGVAVLAPRGRGYEAWLPEHLQVDLPDLASPAPARDQALARAWSELGSDPDRRRRLADRQQRAARAFLGPDLGREHCRASARWLIEARASETPAIAARQQPVDRVLHGAE
jgi:glycosyltransferase involved in cell wall biosynthesis